MRRGVEWRLLRNWLILQDALGLACAFGLAYLLRFEADLLPASSEHGAGYYLGIEALILVGWSVLFALHGLYRTRRLLEGYQEYAQVFRASILGVVMVAAVSFLLGGTPVVSRGYLLVAWALAMLLVCGGRFGLRRVAWRLRARGLFVRRALIVGTGQPGAALARRLAPARSTGVEVLGFLGDYVPVGTTVAPGLRVLGSPRQAAEVGRAVGAEELLVVTRAVSWETLDALVQDQASGLEVRLVPSLSRLALATVETERIGSVTLLHPERRSISGADAGLKAALDMSVGLALLTLAAPWLAWQRWRGGPWRRIAVVGRHGRPFLMYALPGAGLPIGLARLPAVLNVLRREMSLVGPAPRAVGSEPLNPEWEPLVRGARPGLTGLVPHGTAQALPEERLALDLYYLQSYTVWMDLQTLLAALRRRGRGAAAVPEHVPAPAREGVLAGAPERR